MVQASNLGYPRIGRKRELKHALEQFWSGKWSETELLEQAATLRRQHWQLQQHLGLTHIPSNDFSFYDHVLDTIAMVGAVPTRYHWKGPRVDLRTYFVMARGVLHDQEQASAIPAMQMTKWFDTNYHSVVPEFEAEQQFTLASTKPVDEFLEAKALGVHTRPVLLGPVSFLLLGTMHAHEVKPLSLLERLLPVYEDVLLALARAGADWLQIDEPCLVLDLNGDTLQAYQATYERLATYLAAHAPTLRMLLATYFGDLRENLATVLRLPVSALHLDLVRAPAQLEQVLPQVPASLSLSLGVVDGRNIWRTEFDRALALAERGVKALGTERMLLAPSCSLIHVPIDVLQETHLDDEMRAFLAFAQQKLEDMSLLTRALNEGTASIEPALRVNRQSFASRHSSPRIHSEEVARRVQAVNVQMAQRPRDHHKRKQQQQAVLNLPPLPTTTIGSYPQTAEIRAARGAYKGGKMDRERYEAFLKQEIEHVIRFQEEVGLDVLVHGEFERSDMVEYFAEQLTGMLFTQQGWVQSYGSLCVRPPIIYGDVARPHPMTVQWAQFAQALTARPVKGMLTGPVTIMQWSFVRDDQPRWETCQQIALSIRDEVQDLEAAGMRVIQIDEPALREGLPLRHADWQHYLDWAVRCFRLTTSLVQDSTQIHTHLCYSKFDDIIEDIARMDADVALIEASRSHFELLEALVTSHYPNDIGLGIYDVHSPRVPSTQEVVGALQHILQVLPSERVWVNPDCGLKTRRWEEIRPALAHVVEAAHLLRSSPSRTCSSLAREK
jgi:5-methyltetrahydropteroyltriglutamate--homocysteine methyltransferase